MDTATKAATIKPSSMKDCCFYCLIPGHRFEQCTKPPHCLECNNGDHWTVLCLKLNKLSKKYSVLVVEGQVNGIDSTVGLDTLTRVLMVLR